MGNADNKIAKELLIKYSGSHFHMEREGEYDFYRSFNISEEQEKLWIKEYQHEILDLMRKNNDAVSVDVYFITLCRIVIQYKDTDSFKSLIGFASDKYMDNDSFTKLRIAEGLFTIVDSFINTELNNFSILLDTKRLAVDILKNIIANPITINPYYKSIEYLSDLLNEEKIIARANNNLRSWGNLNLR